MMAALTLGNYQLEGFGIRTTLQGVVEWKNSEGSSSTGRSFRGFKPKVLQVECQVRFSEPEKLQSLIKILEKTEGTEPVKHMIRNVTAESAGIRKVQVYEQYSVQEQNSTQSWKITFSLIESGSIPEKKELRTSDENLDVEDSSGGLMPVADTEPSSDDDEPGFWERILRSIDDGLA